MKKICIRVDGNEIIATGHVMRCISIAQQLRKKGSDIIFVVADERPYSMIAENGFNCHILNSVWNDMDLEIGVFCEFLESNDIDILLLDSYYATWEYMNQVSKIAKICYIDDLDKFIYPIHTVINYSLDCNRNYEDRYKSEQLNTKFLLGGGYAPLREEFAYKPFNVRENVEKVLLTTGGTDQLNMTYDLLVAFLNNQQTAKLEYNVIVGRFNENREQLIALSENNSNVKLHENISNMSHWMRCCDVAISAAGTTKFELSACGIPSICFEIADNQKGAKEWEDKGYMLYAGNAYMNKSNCIHTCFDCLCKLSESYDLRCKLSGNMQKLVDGLGAERIADYLINLNKQKK